MWRERDGQKIFARRVIASSSFGSVIYCWVSRIAKSTTTSNPNSAKYAMYIIGGHSLSDRT